MSFNLNDKKGVVTGATSGIGFAAAKAMIEAGAEIIVTGQDADRVHDAANILGPRAHPVVAASQDPDAAARLAEHVRDIFGTIDFVYANAGVAWPGPIGQIAAENAAAQLAINTTGPLLSVQALKPYLNTGSSVFFTTSNLDTKGMPGMAVYAASKAALRSIVRTLAAEFKDDGIRVNSIAPGPVETPIYSKLGMSEDELNGMASGILAQVPLGRFGKAEEIAGAAVFLASDASSFMLGEEITIDGGWSTL